MVREHGLPARSLHLLQRASYRRAAANVALSEGMATRLVARGAPAASVRVIPNWADGRTLVPIERAANPFRRAHGFGDRFVAMYSGNLGAGHDVTTFIDAAKLLSVSHPEVLFAFIGDGVRRREAEERARGLENVRFLPYQSHETVPWSLAAADVHLISLREDLDGLIVPSKLYAAIAVGRPIMFVGPPTCEVARVVREHALGGTGRPGDARGLADALGAAARSDRWCAERGSRARSVFASHFDRPIATRAWRETLESAAATSR
jgi:glycosyltransferase involved in cell wall biosynthesis